MSPLPETDVGIFRYDSCIAFGTEHKMMLTTQN
jgi:hypothetical protein